MIVKEVKAKKIKDSRGDPTIEVSVNNCRASSPDGKSKGKYETPPYYKSLDWNIQFLNRSSFEIGIESFEDLGKIEQVIREKMRFKDAKQFGANALFAFESAILKALAKSQKRELWQVLASRIKKIPGPLGNVIGGGLHAHNEKHPMFQEFLLIPQRKSAKENVTVMNAIYRSIGRELHAATKSDEGAWETSLDDEGVLAVLTKYQEVEIGIDFAASSFYRDGKYIYKSKTLAPNEQITYLNSLVKRYHIMYIEDPLEDEDFSGFAKIKKNKKTFVVGDDLTATQIPRATKAIKSDVINGMIIKPNQNGSLIELKEIFDICKKNKIKTILSHRSGETMDDSLADLAVGFQADFIKCGISTKWREVKLRRLIEIEKSLR